MPLLTSPGYFVSILEAGTLHLGGSLAESWCPTGYGIESASTRFPKATYCCVPGLVGPLILLNEEFVGCILWQDVFFV